MEKSRWKFGAAVFAGVLVLSSCSSSGDSDQIALDESDNAALDESDTIALGDSDELALDEAAPVADVVPPCPDLPRANEIDEADFEARVTTAFDLLGTESGLQGAGARAEGLIGLEFVDPLSEGFDELLAQLPEGFCIDSIQFTSETPDVLDVIDEDGQVSELPEAVGTVDISFSPDIGEPTSETTELTLWLTEQGCASGREMGDRLLGPEVHEAQAEILIAAGVAIQIAEQECPGNPPTEVTVTLDAPVGDRVIRNALTGEAVALHQ